MRKFFILLSLLLFVAKLSSQINEIRDKSLVITNPNVLPYGVNINMENTGTPRWAREFNFSFNRKGDIFSFGVVANGLNMEYGYIGGNRLDNTNINHENPFMVFRPNGNIGIGTLSPSAKLDVRGEQYLEGTLLINPVNKNNYREGIRIRASSTNWATIVLGAVANEGTSENAWSIHRKDNNDFAISRNSADGSNGMVITKAGNVGFGKAYPTHKLEVNGTIRSKEVKIESTGWSDFVFDKNYELPMLQTVEQHIKDKGHLPGIPSEKDVIENGINVGEMQAKLLQKIEELTLYVIEQEKRITEQNRKILELEKRAEN